MEVEDVDLIGLEDHLTLELPDGTVIIAQEDPKVTEPLVTEEPLEVEDPQRQYFAGLLEQSGLLWQDGSVLWNDVPVVCADGSSVSVPSIVLASICPVFRAAAAAEPDLSSLSLPDISKTDLEYFLSKLFEQVSVQDIKASSFITTSFFIKYLPEGNQFQIGQKYHFS